MREKAPDIQSELRAEYLQQSKVMSSQRASVSLPSFNVCIRYFILICTYNENDESKIIKVHTNERQQECTRILGVNEYFPILILFLPIKCILKHHNIFYG